MASTVLTPEFYALTDAMLGPPPEPAQEWGHAIHLGDCLNVLRQMPADYVDLIVTSPPYADARQHTYGGKPPNGYVEWFMPRATEMLRVLKPTGSFVLNIKERCADGERHTYVLDLILALKHDVGFRWVEEYIWHKTTAMPGKWKYRFRDAWERILHFSKTPDLKMRQDAVKQPIGEWTQSRLKNMSERDTARVGYPVQGRPLYRQLGG